ncbi:MAG: pantetheine-phosphate adenylyltransferase [Armatimonadetes bacterium]|nr:pantetheine-phosphate adenylyltransferase [Armatimonadota bacterium]
MNRTAIYPGSFDPLTNGHMDIIERGSHLFDRLIVAVGINTEKPGYFSVEERLEDLRVCCAKMPNVEVASFEGLLVEYARSRNSRILLRGLRAISDYDYEFRIALANRRLAAEVETVFLIAREEYSFLASSVVREVAKFGGDYAQFVPENVAKRIENRLKS